MADRFLTYSGTALPYRIESVHKTQADANSYATGKAGITALPRALTTADDVGVGWWLTDDDPATVVEDYPTDDAENLARRKRINALAIAHGNRCWDHMRPGWVMGDGAGIFATGAPTPETQKRFRNTYYWIVSGVGAVATACQDAGALWTADACETALEALQSLIPDNPESIHGWYTAHNETTWTDYFTERSDAIHCYFRWERGNPIPAFTDDKDSSTRWNGASNSATPSVAITPNKKPDDFKFPN